MHTCTPRTRFLWAQERVHIISVHIHINLQEYAYIYTSNTLSLGSGEGSCYLCTYTHKFTRICIHTHLEYGFFGLRRGFGRPRCIICGLDFELNVCMYDVRYAWFGWSCCTSRYTTQTHETHINTHEGIHAQTYTYMYIPLQIKHVVQILAHRHTYTHETHTKTH